MMAWSRAFAASPCRRRVFPSACRGSPRRWNISASSTAKPEPGPVVVTVFDKDRLADYQQMVAKLRAPISAPSFISAIRKTSAISSNTPTSATRLASSSRAPTKRPKAKSPSRTLIVGAELAKLEKGREEHLQKQAEAQISVPKHKLVEAVREVLARHGAHGRAMNRAVKIILIVVCAALSSRSSPRSPACSHSAPATVRTLLASLGEPFRKVDFSDLPPVGKAFDKQRLADRVPRLGGATRARRRRSSSSPSTAPRRRARASIRSARH